MKLFLRCVANDSGAGAADICLHQQREGHVVHGVKQIARSVNYLGAGNRIAKPSNQRQLPRFRRIDREDVGAIQDFSAAALPMVEKRLGVKDRMFGLTQETRLSDPAKDEGRGNFATSGIEAMGIELDGHISHAVAFKRCEQGLKPLRVLVEDSKLSGAGAGGTHCRGHLGSGSTQVHKRGSKFQWRELPTTSCNRLSFPPCSTA